MPQQVTLKQSIQCIGKGLHTGKPVTLQLLPAPVGTGIQFHRVDVCGKENCIPAHYTMVTETRLGTTLTNKAGISVATVEHLMAALWGMGIDNVIIEIDGPEVPIMDGSSEPFIFLLECAGLKNQHAERTYLRVLRTIEVHDGESRAVLSPSEEAMPIIDIGIHFNHPAIKAQHARYDFNAMTFKQQLSRARTFGFAHEVDALRKAGLARGGSLENAIVLDEEAILNPEGLRFADEFIRHKALDCLGDVYLAGHYIKGHFSFYKPGHTINNKLMHALFAHKRNYCLEEEQISPPATKRHVPVFMQDAVPAYA